MSRKSKTGLLPWSVVTVIVIVLLPAGYMGAYFAALDEPFPIIDDGHLFAYPHALYSKPKYHYPAKWIELVFEPAHQFERHYLRPNLWVDDTAEFDLNFRAAPFNSY